MKAGLRKILILSVITCLLPAAVFASARSLMEDGLKEFERENYYDAYLMFHKVFHQLPVDVNPYASTSLFMVIRSLYFLDRHEDVIAEAGLFTDTFEESRYREDVLYTKSASLMKTGRYLPAVSFALKVVYQTERESLQRKALELAREGTRQFLSPEEIKTLKALAGSRAEMRGVDLLLAEKMKLKGDVATAQQILQSVKTSLMTLFEVNYYNQILKGMEEEKRAKIDLAVILPLSGPERSAGKALLDGMLYALNRFRHDLLHNISLVVLDNQSDILKSIKYTYAAADMEDVIAILGPLSSQDAIAMASICDFEKIPLFTPTATRDGLSALSPYVFQLNPDQDERAYALARYAVDSLKYETFAILAPADDYGRRISDSFSRTVARSGGMVIRREWFSDPNDLKSQFMNIRKAAFILQAADSLDTTNILLDPELELKTPADSLKITLDAIDAFYLPIYHDQIESVAPQLAYYNFDTHLLGDGNWLDESLLSRYRRYVNGMIISADHLMLEQDPRVSFFREEYESQTGKTPDRLTIYGYETMVLMLNLIENGNTTREALRIAVNNMGEFRGVIRNVRFSKRKPGVNTAVRLLEFRNNTIYTLQE
ncbi:MAG: hypothetical protein XD77_0286 [Marinimicrobia bacterium 46_47]|nr:MAG: hypothetical protein XD77_0286 [Marinimicrobia bacterium 46_47]KUK91903.1 MAG: extracellular ligand-binding receptor [Marinimicrobia bacterium 46_43]HBY18800.1 hypothetical protein [Candidatus Neomarinimicrobiota bacterium]